MIKTYKLAAVDVRRAAVAKGVNVAAISRALNYTKERLNGFMLHGADGWDARNLAHYLEIKI